MTKEQAIKILLARTEKINREYAKSELGPLSAISQAVLALQSLGYEWEEESE